MDALKKRLTAAQENASKLQSQRDQARAELAKAIAAHTKSIDDLTAQLGKANARLAKHLDGGLTFASTPQTWDEALKACDNDYIKAAKAYPELKVAHNQKNTTK